MVCINYKLLQNYLEMFVNMASIHMSEAAALISLAQEAVQNWRQGYLSYQDRFVWRKITFT